MSKSSSQPTQQRSLLTLTREVAEAKFQKQIDIGIQLTKSPIDTPEALNEVQGQYYTWDEFNVELLTHIFTTDAKAREYTGFAFGSSERQGFRERRQDLYDHIHRKIRRLESFKGQLELIPTVASSSMPARAPTSPASRRVFIVHGHDNAAREIVARYLDKLGLDAIILHERANAGSTLIEKLEREADVSFAIVLVTPDDVVYTSSGSQAPTYRARQNVILELGYFAGRLGRSRVCVLKKSGVEMPSDILGLSYVSMDGSNAWKLDLARELKATGFDIDLNKAI